MRRFDHFLSLNLVQALAPLDTTLEEMRDRLPSSDPSFRHRMKTFMDELLLVRYTDGRKDYVFAVCATVYLPQGRNYVLSLLR